MDKVNEIKKRLKDAGVRYWANDNISEYIEEGEKQKLIEEAMPAFENVLQSLVIDTKTDPNSMDTARRMAKMYINEIIQIIQVTSLFALMRPLQQSPSDFFRCLHPMYIL